jgi:hypothetical protein
MQDVYYCWDKDCILAAANQPGGDTTPAIDPVTGNVWDIVSSVAWPR